MDISQGRDERQQKVHYQAGYHCGQRELNRSGELSKPWLRIIQPSGNAPLVQDDLSGFPMPGHSVPKARKSLQVEIFRV